ncbi:hypothetical protein Tco_0480340 [Tanacetum coccineum]
MMEDFMERMNQELRKQEALLAAQREQELLAQKQAAQEKQVPSPNSVLSSLLKKRVAQKLYCIHNNVDYLFESDLNSKLLSINLNSQHLDKEKQEGRNCGHS